jgi:hypothetical protein
MTRKPSVLIVCVRNAGRGCVSTVAPAVASIAATPGHALDSATLIAPVSLGREKTS